MVIRLCYNRGVPCFVDHAERRADLAASLWRVVLRDGIRAVSVRTVAAEAQTSPGALRHYFSTQDELLGFALTEAVARAERRMAPRLDRLRGLEGAIEVCEQYLPLDDGRRAETTVVLAFLGVTLSSDRLRAVATDADDRGREGVRLALHLLQRAALLHPGRDETTEIDRLIALLNGLGVQAVLLPARYPPGRLRAALRRHLVDLAVQPTGA